MKYLNELPSTPSYIYLASPYSGTDFEQQLRYQHVLFAVKHIVDSGFAVYSPIVHCHELAMTYGMPRDATYWELVNSVFIAQASEVWVLMIHGWEESKGITGEQYLARKLEKPIRFLYFPPDFGGLVVMDKEDAG